MASDRIFGLVVLGLALAYIASAFQIQTSFLSDPVGPKAFPILIGTVASIACLFIIIKPDPNPQWPSVRVFGALGVAVLALIAYSYALKPLGFIIPTAIVATILSYQLRPNRLGAVFAGVGLSIVLFIIFKYVLGLSLIGFNGKWLGL